MQILIVEDDFISRRLLTRYLEGIGTCEVAINGEEALASVRSALDNNDHYQLICLDVMMPGMDGQEVLKGIRDLEDQHGLAPEQRCKIVMNSALDKQDVIAESLAAQADDYIVKPILKRNFMAVLDRLGLLADQPSA